MAFNLNSPSLDISDDSSLISTVSVELSSQASASQQRVFRVSKAVQDLATQTCVGCGILVSLSKGSKRHKDQRKQPNELGKKISVAQSAEFYARYNVICYPHRHAICDECAKNIPKLQKKDIRYRRVNESNMISECLNTILVHLRRLACRLLYANTELENKYNVGNQTNKHNCVKYRLTTQSDCQKLTRLSKNQIEDLGDKYELKPDHIFLTLAICKSKSSYRVASVMFGHSIGHIHNAFSFSY